MAMHELWCNKHALLLTILMFSSSLSTDGQVYQLGRRDVKYADPDSVGYHYCAFWQLADGTTLFSSCDPFSMDRCGRPLDFKYQCCSGFKEDYGAFPQRNGRDTCSKVISPYETCTQVVLQNPEVAAIAPELDTIENSGQKQPYTIFAPHVSNENLGIQQVIASQHMVKGRYYVDDLTDGMELQTLDPKRKLYVTRYPYGVVTVNCVEMIGADLECKSGIVHGVRKPLTARAGTGDADTSSVYSFLKTNSETIEFAGDLPAELCRKLADVSSGIRYTVFAPRKQSWSAIKQKYSGEKLKQIAAAHVVPGQHCSSGLIQSSSYLRNVESERLEVVCLVDENNQERRYVMTECDKKHELVESDLVASNGVIHLIDEPIIPLSVMTLKDLEGDDQCAKSMRITEIIKLMKECDLQMEPGQKYAIIMPNDESFVWWSNYAQFRSEYERFQVDKEYRCRVARYHIIKSNDRLDNIPEFASNTMGHRTNNENNYLYETTYFEKTSGGSQLNFHYSPVNDLRAVEMDGVSLYFTPRINVIPEQNLTDILESRPDTTIANNLTTQVDMNEKYFTKTAPKNLYLVTNDNGWKDPRSPPGSTNPYRPELTMYPKDSLEKFLLLHHIPLYLWGGDIGYFKKNSVHKFMTSVGIEIIFWMDDQGVMRIGHDKMPREEWPRVVKWNLPARDGIIWVIDGVLKCPEDACPLFLEDIDYYDLYVAACQTKDLAGESDTKRLFKDKPIEVASRHPSKCTVILQLTEQTVTRFEAD